MRSERGRGVGRRVQGAWAAPGLGPRGSGAAERSSGHTGLAEKRPELRGPGCRDPAARGLVYRVSTWRGPSQAVRTPRGPREQGAALSQLCACSFGDPLTLTRLPPAPRPQRGLEACRRVAGLRPAEPAVRSGHFLPVWARGRNRTVQTRARVTSQQGGVLLSHLPQAAGSGTSRGRAGRQGGEHTAFPSQGPWRSPALPSSAAAPSLSLYVPSGNTSSNQDVGV